MKRVLAIAAACAVAVTVQADIGFQAAHGNGVFENGGSWTGGGWPSAGDLFQVVWSDSAPGAPGGPLDPSGANPGEFIVGAGPQPDVNGGLSYGYVYNTPLIVVTSGDIGGANPNAGFLYMRIFEADAPADGVRFFQSTVVVDTSTLQEYDPGNPGTIAGLEFGNGTESPYNGAVIPEPATVALWGLGLLTIMVRRKIRS